MRDTRIQWFAGTPNLAISADQTLNGETIDLKDGYTGNYFEGAPVGYGVGVEALFTSITGTAFTINLKWQVSADGSTWLDDQVVVPTTDLVAAKTTLGTKYAVQSRLRTPYRYCRLVLVTASMSGESFVFNVWSSDGTTEHGDATQPRI